MYTTCSEGGVFMYWTGKSINNLLSYCGLNDARINASDKDLPVPMLKSSQGINDQSRYCGREAESQSIVQMALALSRQLLLKDKNWKMQWPIAGRIRGAGMHVTIFF